LLCSIPSYNVVSISSVATYDAAQINIQDG
jgi:hypothetical protein